MIEHILHQTGQDGIAAKLPEDRAEIFPRSETEFFLKVDVAQISFIRGESGKANKLILRKRGQEIPGKRVK